MASGNTDAYRRNHQGLKLLYQPAGGVFARFCLALLLVFLVIAPSFGGEKAGAGDEDLVALRMLKAGPSGQVEAIAGPTMLRVKGQERLVKLAGIWPESAADGMQAIDHPAAGFLREAVAGRYVRLFLDQQGQDRSGNWLAQVEVSATDGSPGFWLQGRMLAGGHGRAYSTPGTAALAGRLLALEGEARDARLGLWRLPAFAVRAPTELDDAIGSFQIAEGLVQKVAVTGSRIYLNFGQDWQDDFTVMVLRTDASQFPGRLRGLKALAGERIRVRGWVFRLNGPAIRADHAGTLEILME